MNFFREQYYSIRRDSFLLAWNLSTLLVILLPLIIFGVARRGAESNGNGNNYDDDNYEERWNQQNEWRFDQYGNFLGQKHWWQFWKRNNHFDRNGNSYYQEQNQGDQRQNEMGAPWWCKCPKRVNRYVSLIVAVRSSSRASTSCTRRLLDG